ncbi:HyaD/HybD family hydrogenase maturation endopeptidase [Sulfurimonas sp. HSL3-7]|uniref:HyaD/HybD family hydrogenase maturation endopeptidase n=1 Tax=Sulfonitrofixus jiaomeiensis TaxID=3131938 RepID=UPI0031F899D7
MMKQRRFSILGVGNILEKDDGIAVYATAYLEQNYTFEPSIEIINGGVEGINLLNVFMEYDRILILDAIDIDDEPGSIYHIPSHELTGYGLSSGGAHEIGVMQCIDMLELIGRSLPDSSVLGIVPKTVDVHIGLTPLLLERFPTYINAIITILENENIVVKKSAKEVTLQTIISRFENPRDDTEVKRAL